MTLREMLLHVKDNHGVEISVYQTPTVIFKGDASAALSEDGLRRWKNHEVQSVYANGSALRIEVDIVMEAGVEQGKLVEIHAEEFVGNSQAINIESLGELSKEKAEEELSRRLFSMLAPTFEMRPEPRLGGSYIKARMLVPDKYLKKEEEKR